MLAAAAVSFVGTAVNRFSEVGSALDDMAGRTGVSVEALSQLQYVTQQTSTSMESLQAALVKMGAFLAAVRDGSSEANQTLANLGLTAAQFENMPADAQLRLFADALTKVPAGAQQSVAAMKVFGKGAVDLLPMLNAGSAGIAAMMLEADRLGITMTARSAAAASVFGDSLDRLKATFNALVVQVGSQFGPVLTDLAITFSKLLADNGEMIRETITLVAVFGAVSIAMKSLTYATQAYATAQAFAVALTAGPAGWAKLAIGLTAAAAAATYLNAQFGTMNSRLDEQIRKNAELQSSVRDTGRVFRTEAEQRREADMQANAWAYKAFVQGQAYSRDEINAYTASRLEIIKTAEARRLHAEEFDKQTKALEKYQKALDGSGWTTQFRSIGDELRILRGEITETELEFERMAAAGVDDRHIQALREQTAERDRLRKQVDKEKADAESVKTGHAERMEAERQNLIATRNEVMASFTTPLQKSVAEFAAKSKEVQAAVEAGKLDPKAAVKFLENEQKRLQAGLQSEQKQVISSAIDVRSEESNRMLVGLLNRGSVDPAAKTNSLIEQTNRYLFELKTAIANQAMETKEFGS